MGGAKNVILLLTKGCMDRFLDDAEKTFAEVDKEGGHDPRNVSRCCVESNTQILQICCAMSIILL